MAVFSQSNQPLAIHTALPQDQVLLAGLRGTEAISELYTFSLELLALKPLDFDALLGKPAAVRLSIPGSPERWIHGIISTLEQGARVAGPLGGTTFYRHRAELVPSFWLCGLRRQTRMFQSMSVPDIVRQILVQQWGLDLESHLSGTYPQRDYCVQYQETDLQFVMRLLEEEGIAFFFQHSKSKETILLADSMEGHADLPGASELLYDEVGGGRRPQARITSWTKRQTLRHAHVRLRDHSFQLPTSNLEATSTLVEKVAVGQTDHAIRHSVNRNGSEMLEMYEPLGGYAWRFDGVSPEGSNQPAQLQQVFQENKRVSDLRAGEEATAALVIDGAGQCGHLQPGYKFSLTQHFNANGNYLLSRVEHEANLESAYLASEAGSDAGFFHSTHFQARPTSLPFRPARRTPRPRIQGILHAQVVGPKDSEIFVDRFGRVKVKFYWDRNDQTGPMNSCWLRVGQTWAGNRWGAYFWPRVGHEVIVAFEDGNPDRPLIVGSVYNEQNMPPFELPANRSLAGVKSCSLAQGSSPAQPLVNYSGYVINDESGKEHIEIHGEKHVAFYAEETERHWVDGPQRQNVNGFRSTHVGSLPGGSGSGGGPDPDHPYIYSGYAGGGKIGVDFTSVCGLDQTIILGLYSTLTVGDYVNIVCNPLGLAADLGMSVSGAAALEGLTPALVAGLASPFLGYTNITMGSQTQLSYGTNITIARGAKAPISEVGRWSGGDLEPGEAVWASVSVILMTLSASAATAGTIQASINSYDTSQPEWLVCLASTGLITGVWEMVEVFRATYNQVMKAKQAVEAAALLAQDATAVENIADTLLAIFNQHNTQFASAKLVHGINVEYSDATRILGANEANFFFSGTQSPNQSVFAMGTDLIQLLTGVPTEGPRIKLSSSAGGTLTQECGEEEVGSSISMTPVSLTLSVGEPGEGPSISLTETGIMLKVGPCSIELEASGLINLITPGGELTMSEGAIYIDGSEEITLMGGPEISIIADLCEFNVTDLNSNAIMNIT